MRADVPHLLHSFARPAARRDEFLEIVSGDGAEVLDASGRRYVDALGSLWYCNVGHGRREIADAVSTQMHRLEAFHTFERFTNGPAEALAGRLSELAPMPDTRVFLTSGGSESVETAVKLARAAQAWAGHPERTLVVSRRPSYHGVTYAALSATGIAANQQGFGPLLPDVVQVAHDDLDELDRLGASQAGRIAAVIAEPVVGAGGVYPPADGYLAGLRARCDAWGAYLVLDEVICGFGRLGRWWGSQYFGVVPDLVTFAKGVTSGYLPVGGVIVGAAVRDALEADESAVLRHGYTYGGHPTAAAAALANLDLLEEEGLVERAPLIAGCLGAGLAGLVDGDRIVACRGLQGIWAVELAEGLSAPSVRDALLDHGVIARPIGASILAYCPPLVVTEEQMERCVDATRRAVANASY